MRGLGVLLCLLWFGQTVRAQSYPRWFLEQGGLGCGLTAVGYAATGYYEDSSASLDVRTAKQNLAREQMTVIAGGQSFWATEAGTAWMGSDFRIAVDSSALRNAVADTGNAELFFAGDMVLALVSRGKCDIPVSMNEPVSVSPKEPKWVHSSENNDRRIFAVGVAQKYFYESSSWEAAERMALVGLAKECGDSVIAIQKQVTGSGQQVLNEEISVTLRDYAVVARWYDAKNRVFYVLISVERRNIERDAGQ